MTLGDFSLFTYYLGFTTEFTAMTGATWAFFKQAGVALARMLAAGLSHVILESTSHGLAQHRVTGAQFSIMLAKFRDLAN